MPALSKLNSAGYIVGFAKKELQRYEDGSKDEDGYRDMLARFKRQRDGVEVMSANELLSHASGNMLDLFFLLNTKVG